jgi:hypothetical protein
MFSFDSKVIVGLLYIRLELLNSELLVTRHNYFFFFFCVILVCSSRKRKGALERGSICSRSKWRRRSSNKKREEMVVSLCALAGNCAASKQDDRPGRGAPNIYALVSAPKKREVMA